MSDSTGKKSKVSARDKEILAAAWECFETMPKVNYELLAQKTGLKNAKSASTMFSLAKKNLLAEADSSSPTKRKQDPASDAADSPAPEDSPTKKAKKATPRKRAPPKKKEPTPAPSDGSDDDEKAEGVETPIKKEMDLSPDFQTV